ncbi:hypothetical protein KSP40_PGU001516 [Platanthera guangdongensis]|uniref:Uncharacterized protein n=1 Tax=Platanthera guangdongensis TaxID=2320717 RepID=A0ABR2M3V7_9ASPA
MVAYFHGSPPVGRDTDRLSLPRPPAEPLAPVPTMAYFLGSPLVGFECVLIICYITNQV